jgi:phage tail sheath protein FI
MPASFTYPGVYVDEAPSGAQAVPAAATSIALFIGMIDKGPFGVPTRVQSLNEYSRLFGEATSGEMADQVGQFFINGGGDAYVMRIAKNPHFSKIVLQAQDSSTDVLSLEARDPGGLGDQLRIEIDYDTPNPDRTFNLSIYRAVLKPDGSLARTEPERWPNLSMNPADPRFAPTFITNSSKLLTAAQEFTDPTTNLGGTSISGLLFSDDLTAANAGSAQKQLFDIIKNGGSAFRVSIGGRPAVDAVIQKTGPALSAANVIARIEAAIEGAYQALGINVTAEVSVVLNKALASDAALGSFLEIQSNAGPVVISPAGNDDVAVALALGTASGGIEFDRHSVLRPAPTGFATAVLPTGAVASSPDASWLAVPMGFGHVKQNETTTFTFNDPLSSNAYSANTGLGATATKLANGTVASNAVTPLLGSLAILRQALDTLAANIAVQTSGYWTAARSGLGIAMRPVGTVPSGVGINAKLTTQGAHDIGAAGGIANGRDNASSYMLGTVIGGYTGGNVHGTPGTEPGLTEYKNAFAKVESDVEIFNMMILPRTDGQDDVERKALWGPASAFCSAKRAILFVDPPNNWATIADAEAGASAMKIGVDTRNSVIYWPLLKVPTPDLPSGKTVDPSGSMAGLYARTDARFGTWRAPAGIEATLTGVVGLDKLMSDAQQGLLNPKALNVVRLFPSGITAWGARTMVGADDTGNIDDKYVNVRRMMLFIENSLYRGLRFAVFRNNAEPLWASIRLAAGSFMHGLMTQGAFASDTKSEAYYVRCDSTTTTPTDINLGIVNVLVGFAPNKPAEFVHLTVTQILAKSDF